MPKKKLIFLTLQSRKDPSAKTTGHMYMCVCVCMCGHLVDKITRLPRTTVYLYRL